MSYNEEDLIFTPDEFSGQVRLFPLPNLVLFPHVIQPLRVFEPRYVDLLHDALATDRLITMALLPSTVIPVGRTAAGLPVGVQIVGPYLEDRTPLAFAAAAERELGGFVPPAGFD